MIQRIILTVIFTFVWWLAYSFVGASAGYLLILGSILAVCVCCCSGREPSSKFNLDHYLSCIRRCWVPTLTLVIGLLVAGILVVLFIGGGLGGVVVAQIAVASIGGPVLVRLICCAYES